MGTCSSLAVQRYTVLVAPKFSAIGQPPSRKALPSARRRKEESAKNGSAGIQRVLFSGNPMGEKGEVLMP